MSDKSKSNELSISLKVGNDIKNEPHVVSNIFNNYFANVATDIGPRSEISLETNSFTEVISHYADHPSINSIKDNIVNSDNFSFKEISEEDMCKFIKKIDHRKSTGWDNIPPKLIKMAATELSAPCASIFNKTVRFSQFPGALKMAEVSPIFKAKDNMVTVNYRPVSVLPCVSKLFERVLYEQLYGYFEKILSDLLAVFRKRYGCNHVLLN